MVASEIATETIWQVALEQSKYWKNINPKAADPLEGTWIYLWAWEKQFTQQVS